MTNREPRCSLYNRRYEKNLKNVLREKERDGMMYVLGYPRPHIEK